jgi:hypothetical protein
VSVACALYRFRMGKRSPDADSPRKAILDHCFNCLAGDARTVRRGGHSYSRSRPTRLTAQCTRSDCALFPLRTGKRPSQRSRTVGTACG